MPTCAPDRWGGAVVFLESDRRRVASVPASVLVPAGKRSASFPVTVYHVHGKAETVGLAAVYGGQASKASLTVAPPAREAAHGAAAAPGHDHAHEDDE